MISALLWAFGLCALLQCCYWLGLFSRLARKPGPLPAKAGGEWPAVSLVVCARNEAENLRRHLPHLLEQDYPEYEVWVVDDASEDETPELLSDFQRRYAKLQVLRLEYPGGRKHIGKKHALSQGIGKARHDTLLLTDADCRPASRNWIRQMAARMSEGRIVLGYSPYLRKAGALNAFIRWEGIYTAIQYLSFALWGMPYMGVGRNLMYDRKLYRQAGGFESHAHIPSGDDDLLVNAVAHAGNTAVCLHPHSFVYSLPKETFRGYFRQKRRHVTTGRHYRPLHQFLLGALSLSHAGFYALGVLAIIFAENYRLPTSLVLVSTLLMKTAVFAAISGRMGSRDLAVAFPLLDVAYLLYYALLSPALFFGKTKQWE